MVVNIMNTPRFIVYTTPRPLFHFGIYAPPQNEVEFITYLVKSGYTPCVNALKGPSVSELNRLCGFVLIEESDQLINCKEYTEGRVKCLQWYHEPLSDEELAFVMEHMHFLYFGGDEPVIPEQFLYLQEKGCFRREEENHCLVPDCIQEK